MARLSQHVPLWPRPCLSTLAWTILPFIDNLVLVSRKDTSWKELFRFTASDSLEGDAILLRKASIRLPVVASSLLVSTSCSRVHFTECVKERVLQDLDVLSVHQEMQSMTNSTHIFQVL